MKSKTQNKSKKIYNLSIFTAVFILVFSYIVCIYKTVVLASDSEIYNKKISTLTATINQKEFDYIEKISSIDIDKATALGYQKNKEDQIAYYNTNDNKEFARR